MCVKCRHFTETDRETNMGAELGWEAFSGDVRAPFNIIKLINKQSCFPGEMARDRKQEEGPATIIVPKETTQRWRA